MGVVYSLTTGRGGVGRQAWWLMVDSADGANLFSVVLFGTIHSLQTWFGGRSYFVLIWLFIVSTGVGKFRALKPNKLPSTSTSVMLKQYMHGKKSNAILSSGPFHPKFCTPFPFDIFDLKSLLIPRILSFAAS